MIASRALPLAFQQWNSYWGAPDGRRIANRLIGNRRRLRWAMARLCGPFAFQVNNRTRRFEYPWAYFATPTVAGQRVVDLGGSLAGFQFVLSKQDLKVINIDPGVDSSGLGWPVDERSIQRLNRAFSTDVTLIRRPLQSADLEANSIDTVYSISTLEHIPPEEHDDIAKEIGRILRPGGRCVLTIDLFLDLAPFSARAENAWGQNVNVRRFVEASGLALVAGAKEELLGYSEFSVTALMGKLSEYLVGDYPALAQCLVLAKPTEQ